MKGDLIGDKKTGKGNLKWQDGREYTGDVVDGRLHGKGSFKWANGTILEGDFADDKAQSGRLTITLGSSSGSTTYDATFSGGDEFVNGFKVFIVVLRNITDGSVVTEGRFGCGTMI